MLCAHPALKCSIGSVVKPCREGPRSETQQRMRLPLLATIAHTTRAARYALRVAYDGTHFNG